jgi:hypothetical protein
MLKVTSSMLAIAPKPNYYETCCIPRTIFSSNPAVILRYITQGFSLAPWYDRIDCLIHRKFIANSLLLANNVLVRQQMRRKEKECSHVF